jgi:hypothetical protein
MSTHTQSATSRIVGSLVGRLADRIRATRDVQAQLDGFTWHTRPDGTRVVGLTDMPLIAADYRTRTLADPDPLDRMFITPAVIARHHIEVANNPRRRTQRPVDRRSRR